MTLNRFIESNMSELCLYFAGREELTVGGMRQAFLNDPDLVAWAVHEGVKMPGKGLDKAGSRGIMTRA